jgi:hypothetical protein
MSDNMRILNGGFRNDGFRDNGSAEAMQNQQLLL